MPGNDSERTLYPGRPGAPESALPIGQTLGQYRLLRLLGRGGMGEVYEVEHLTLERRYALKLLAPHFAERPDARERFRREAKVMANLDHPNVARVDEFGETDGRCWLRMELAGGLAGEGGEPLTSLEALRRATKDGMDERTLAGILRQVLAGLAHAHERGVIHRDLKPSNVLATVDDRGNPRFKISDFGLVRLVGEAWLRSRTLALANTAQTRGDDPTTGLPQTSSARSLLGTYEYMSPEQKEGEEATERSDLYALGLIAYRLLTGRLAGFRRPSETRPGIVPAWDALIARSLEENPRDRLADCREFGERLADVEREIEARAVGAGQQAAPAVPPPANGPCPPARSSPVTRVMLALAALGIAAVIALFVHRRERPAELSARRLAPYGRTASARDRATGRIAVVAPVDASVHVTSGGRLHAMGVADATGRIETPPLVPGRYTVEIAKSGFRGRTIEVWLTDGGVVVTGRLERLDETAPPPTERERSGGWPGIRP